MAIPTVPTGLAATQPNSGEVRLTWDAQSGSPNYVLYRDGQLVTDQQEAIFIDSNLPVDNTYNYTILAYNSEGSSALSAPVPVTIPDPDPDDYPSSSVPEIPANLGGVLNGPNLIDVAWDVSLGAPDGYRLMRDGEPRAQVKNNAYSDAIETGDSHSYEIQSFDEHGQSDLSAPAILPVVLASHQLTVAAMLSVEAGMDLSIPAGSINPTVTDETGQIIYKLRSNGVNGLILDVGAAGGET